MALHFNQHSLAGLHNRSMNRDENLSHIALGLEDRGNTAFNEEMIYNFTSLINIKVV